MIVLSEQEVKELTGKDRPTAQARELDFMGIPYRPRRNKSLAVLRIHAETVTGAVYSHDRVAPEPTLTLDA